MAQKKRTEAEKEHSVLIANVRELMKTRAGKEFVWWVLGRCGIYDNKFTGNSNTFMLLGKEAVGLEVLDLITDADPTLYPKLLLEKAEYGTFKKHGGGDDR